MKTFYSHSDSPHRGTMHYLLANTYGMTPVNSPVTADIIVWNGGEDIATSIYHEQPSLYSIPLQPSDRDVEEIAMFNAYKNNRSKLLLGICRGSQLLNCLNGGRLFQDVNGHGSSHDMFDLQTKETVKVTSTHHQQMIPAEHGRGIVIGVSSCSTYKNHEAGTKSFKRDSDLSKGQDVEIMWYPSTRSLCIQGHPEYVPGTRFADYTLELINRCFKDAVREKAA